MTTNAIRFASGVYPSATQVRDSARSYFFEELRRVCPEVLHSLRDDLLPLYRELVERHSSAQRARVPAILTSFFALESEEPALAATVMNWCSKFHLTAELDPEPESYGPDWPLFARANSLWPAVRIHETLVIWCRDAGSASRKAEPPRWPRTSSFFARGGTRRILKVPIPHLGQFDGETEYIRAATRVFHRCLRDDMAQQRPNADPALRVRRSFKIRREHFAWLALRQVRGLRAKAIAEWHLMEKGERVETGTVRTGLRDTADYIGLRLRLSPTGRPKKGTVPAP